MPHIPPRGASTCHAPRARAMGDPFDYCTTARKYWPFIAGLMAFAIESIEPSAALVLMGVQFFKSVEL